MLKNELKNHLYYRKRDCKPINSGMTLIEVLIVIVILGLLAAIGYPALSRWIPNYQLKAATRILYADFQKAKLHATKTNQDVLFNFTVSADCSIPTGYNFTDPAGINVVSKSMGNGVCLANPASNEFISGSGFDPRGLPANSSVSEKSIKLKHKKISREYEIVQSLSGSIRVK